MLTYLKITKDILIVLLYLRHCPLCLWAIPENIHTPPPWTTLNWVPRNVRISTKDNTIVLFAGIQSLLIQNLEEFQNFAKL